MSGATLNATKYLKPIGLDKDMVYRAVVTKNDDKRKLGRIKARVEGIFEGIKDDHLPWANPEFHHVQGAFNKGNDEGNFNKDEVSRSGIFYVPQKDQIIGLKFPTGDPHKPVWTSYTVDVEVALPETEENYPDRVVIKLHNGFYVIIDTKTHEFFFNNPGDVNMTILGDCNQYIVGNQQLKVVDSKSKIASYLLNAPDTVLKKLDPSPVKKIPFDSQLPGEIGNRHIEIDGNQTYKIKGNRLTDIEGTDVTNVKKTRTANAKISDITNSPRIEHNGS